MNPRLREQFSIRMYLGMDFQSYHSNPLTRISGKKKYTVLVFLTYYWSPAVQAVSRATFVVHLTVRNAHYRISATQLNDILNIT